MCLIFLVRFYLDFLIVTRFFTWVNFHVTFYPFFFTFTGCFLTDFYTSSHACEFFPLTFMFNRSYLGFLIIPLYTARVRGAKILSRRHVVCGNRRGFTIFLIIKGVVDYVRNDRLRGR